MSNPKDFVIENGVLTKYVGPGGDVVIPEGVTEIKSYAFYPYVDGISAKHLDGRKNIRSVVIPNSVRKIGKAAFGSCEKLTKITASANLTGVGPLAFHNTAWKKRQKGLITLNPVVLAYDGEDAEITIPEGITCIADEAFSNCKAITHVHLPGTVKYIGEMAFSGCTALEYIDIPASVTDIGTGAFAGTLWLNAKTEDFVIINGSLYAYRGTASQVQIPDSVKKIGPFAFARCTAMESVTIPQGVTEIKSSAFAFCKNLKSIEIPDAVTILETNAFFQCSSLRKVSFSQNMRSVGDSAFYGCETLEELPDMSGVAYLGDQAFFGCKKLRDPAGRIIVNQTLFEYENIGEIIELPGTVTRISSEAFDDTDEVIRVIASPEAFGQIWNILKPKSKLAVAISCLEYDTMYDAAAAYVKKSRDKILPEIIRRDDAAMMGRLFALIKKPDLDMVESCLEAAAGKVNLSAFLLDYKAKTFEPAKVEQRREEKTEIDMGLRERKLKDWKEIFKLSVSDGCIRISGYRQDEPVVEIPESMEGHPVTAIGDNAFKGLLHIEQVILPAGIKTIGDNAFKGCTKLERIHIPDGVEDLGVSAFEDCAALTSMDLPNSIQMIWANAFKGCISLEKIHLPENLNKLSLGLFDGCEVLKEIHLPESITAIYDYSFRDCRVLAGINMPEKLEIIGQGAFTNCKSVTELILPDGVKEIENYAFRSCTKLTKLRIPETAKKISPSAFAGCKKLTIHAPAGCRGANLAKKEKIPFVQE